MLVQLSYIFLINKNHTNQSGMSVYLGCFFIIFLPCVTERCGSDGVFPESITNKEIYQLTIYSMTGCS